MASISDKITKTMDGQTPNTTTVSTQRVAGATELQARNLDGWPEDTAVHFTTYRVDSQGEVVDGSEADWMGVVNRNANTIANLTRTDGAPDQGNAVDDVIEPMPTAAWANNLAEGLLECHTAEGKLKEKTVALNNINGGPSAGVLKVDDNGTVTSGKIKASNIDLASLKVNPKFMQTGTFVMTRKANGAGAGSKVVTFGTPFDRPPVVVLTGDAGDAYASVAYLAGTPTTTSFTALYRITTSGGDAQKVVHYTAIDSQAPVLAVR